MLGSFSHASSRGGLSLGSQHGLQLAFKILFSRLCSVMLGQYSVSRLPKLHEGECQQRSVYGLFSLAGVGPHSRWFVPAY